MEFSNKLLLSLKQDLRTLNKISEEIIQKLSFFTLNSWLYPARSYKDVSESHLHNISREKQYLGYLELLIDRLYVIINLAIKYTETFPNVLEAPIPKNVVRPSNLSLGASTDMLWKKLLDLSDLFMMERGRALKENSQREIFDKSTQTNTYSSNICSSCATAISCMREVLNQLEISIDAMFVRKMRRDLHEGIFDVTQNGCMNRLTGAIVEDVKMSVTRLQTVEKQNKQSSAKLRELTITYGESLRIIKSLESSLKKIRKRSRNVRIKNKEQTKKLNEVLQVNRENDYKLSQERRKTKILEKSLQESTVSLALFSTDNERLLKEIQQVLKESVGASSERDLWKSRFSEMYLENRQLKNKLEEFHAEIEPMRKDMEKIAADCEKITAKLEQNDLKIVQRTETFQTLLKSFMASYEKIKHVDAVMFDKIPNISFQITGDPIADMKKQVEMNMFNIKKLERHNTDLLKTIHRVQEKIISAQFS